MLWSRIVSRVIEMGLTLDGLRVISTVMEVRLMVSLRNLLRKLLIASIARPPVPCCATAMQANFR